MKINQKKLGTTYDILLKESTKMTFPFLSSIHQTHKGSHFEKETLLQFRSHPKSGRFHYPTLTNGQVIQTKTKWGNIGPYRHYKPRRAEPHIRECGKYT